MKKLKILSDDGKRTEYIVNDLLESAYQFYGNKYKDIISQTVKDTYFYETAQEETFEDVIKQLINLNIPIINTSPEAINLSYRENGKTFNYIIWMPKDDDIDYCNIAHELYGHGVCEKKKNIIDICGDKFFRNGIKIIDKWGHTRFDLLNEGFMEYIGTNIVRLKGGIKESVSQKYELAFKTSSQLIDIEGKNRLIDYLVNYESPLEIITSEDLYALEDILEKDSHHKHLTFIYQKMLDRNLKKIKTKSIYRKS